MLKTVVNEYDPLNRLVRRTYDADGPGAAINAFWAFDNGINPLIEFDAATSADVSHRYLCGPQVDQLLADEQVATAGSARNVLWAGVVFFRHHVIPPNTSAVFEIYRRINYPGK